MRTAIRTRIVKIGNSQGIRIPKLLLEQSGIGEEVEIEIQDCHLIVRAASQSRQGWEEAFATMAKQHNDTLFNDPITTEWEHLEWEW
ncbi:AbrB/MazE/SpoVT family DNA-binding domain-containing protein [Nostoc sp. ChiQUE01b]|uniref:AbrB/MazE/SpoVT family DNA-binding domain-containing protein n=1 Tax=Nostoc sp. ChiQUE01b TaxID=3075376 RepID=UPI002AD3A85B|nr:AbrB/MazE/SpoVT family DNA-binding domain-containing protein [Nostoc sp. ChiQUE01b]MDZ8256852.1 AbrB/MazE/SpoVT family DNA-binding domain-containing protein [Nostoc sp. ChiQUE01b]